MIYDVVIIGAGPCGLAVAARLRENTPAALFTDAEHARYWRRHSRTQTLEKESKKARQQARRRLSSDHSDSLDSYDGDHRPRSEDSPSLLVLDASSDEWLNTWHARFEALKISQLRSPLFFHCDPRDRDGLLEYAHAQDRVNELDEINNVVGREISKHQKRKGKKTKRDTRHLHLDNRDQIDYFTPSGSLFRDYCDQLVVRYELGGLIQKGNVTSVNYDVSTIQTEANPLFTITTSDSQELLARIVVVAIGPGTKPSIPRDLNFLHQGSASHVFGSNSLLPPSIRSSDRPSAIVVVGGGLTSAQIVHLLFQSRVEKVYLILRSTLKIKHFDVDLEWVSKFRNANMAAFWSADSDLERFQMLKAARNGGSMPTRWGKMLRVLEKQGRLECLERSTITDGTWHEQSKTWSLEIRSDPKSCSKPGLNDSESANASVTRNLNDINHVICATGMAPNLDNVSFLDDMRCKYPVETIGGLPQLSNDLKWDDEVPLFLTGALAGLRLGPGAGNLAGARLGAERIAWEIDTILDTNSSATQSQESARGRNRSDTDSAYWSTASSDGSLDERKPPRKCSAIDRSEFTGGFDNQFEALLI